MKDKRPVNKEGYKHGEWVLYFPNSDKVKYIRNYLNGLYDGYGEGWWNSNKLWYNDYWDNGKELYDEDYGSNLIRFNV